MEKKREDELTTGEDLYELIPGERRPPRRWWEEEGNIDLDSPPPWGRGKERGIYRLTPPRRLTREIEKALPPAAFPQLIAGILRIKAVPPEGKELFVKGPLPRVEGAVKCRKDKIPVE